MINFFRFVWAIYFILVLVIIFLPLYPFFAYLLAEPKRYPKAHVLRGIWGRLLLLFTGLRPYTVYEEKLDPKGLYIFTPNHFSYLDVISANVHLPVYFNFMAKSELAKIPLFGIFFRTIDVSVERQSVSGARHALRQGNERLNNGISLLNFPEGGIGKTIPKMRDFKLGAFKMAIEHGVDIVPITLADNWKRMPGGGLDSGGTPGRMRMYVHRPISTKNLKEGDEIGLAKKVYRIIEEKFKEMNKG